MSDGIETETRDKPSPPRRREALYPNHYAWFVLAAALDIMLTWLILRLGGSELNHLAAWIIAWGGLPGMVLFKFVVVVAVVLICEAVGRRRPETGRAVARLAVIITALPPALALAQLLIAVV